MDRLTLLETHAGKLQLHLQENNKKPIRNIERAKISSKEAVLNSLRFNTSSFTS